MIYVMSDIHGCYEKYDLMLQKIDLQDEDKLYILGDFVDRGPNGLAVLEDAIKRDNVIALKGNHDDTAYNILKRIVSNSPDLSRESFIEAMSLWLSDGGEETFAEFKSLSGKKKIDAVRNLGSLVLYEELTINGQNYFLAHTVPEREIFLDEDNWGMDDFIWGEPEYEKVYKEDVIIVTGHTPTGFIDEKSAGYIWKHNNHIAIDCGAVFGNRLACICLDNGQEYYV